MRVLLGTFVFLAAGFCVSTTLCQELQRHGECPGPQKPIRTVQTRSEFGQVMEEEGFRVGVELGVKAGGFAFRTLQNWKSSEEYWLVDLWAPQKNYKDVANVDQRRQNLFYGKTMQKMKPFMSKVKVCRDYTTSCVKNFKDGSLDYVYVDARHDYKGALEDMENYWPKLRCGGILAGHDYMTQVEVGKLTNQDWSLNYDGTKDLTGRVVKGAVDDFAAKHHRQVVLTYREEAWNSWMIRK